MRKKFQIQQIVIVAPNEENIEDDITLLISYFIPTIIIKKHYHSFFNKFIFSVEFERKPWKYTISWIKIVKLLQDYNCKTFLFRAPKIDILALINEQITASFAKSLPNDQKSLLHLTRIFILIKWSNDYYLKIVLLLVGRFRSYSMAWFVDNYNLKQRL